MEYRGQIDLPETWFAPSPRRSCRAGRRLIRTLPLSSRQIVPRFHRRLFVPWPPESALQAFDFIRLRPRPLMGSGGQTSFV
jgi:hypothetical protein